MSTVVTSWTSADPCPCCGDAGPCGAGKCTSYTVAGFAAVNFYGSDADQRIWWSNAPGSGVYPLLVYFCTGTPGLWELQVPDLATDPTGHTSGPTYHNYGGLGGVMVPWDGTGCRTFWLAVSVPGFPDSIEVCCGD